MSFLDNGYSRFVIFLCLFCFEYTSAQDKITIVNSSYQAQFVNNNFELSSAKGKQTFLLFDVGTLKMKNFILDFDVTPHNSDSKFGIVARYQSPQKWVYVGCDSTSDLLTHSHWNLRLPNQKRYIDKDIVKFYKDFKRSVQVKLEEEIVTVYIDGEKVIQHYLQELEGDSGALGFMAHDGGAVRIENVRVRKLFLENSVNVRESAIELKNEYLAVNFVEGYPGIVKYKRLGDGTLLSGMMSTSYMFTVNGVNYKGISTFQKLNENIVYHTVLPDINVSFDTEFSLDSNKVHMRIGNLQEKGTVQVNTLGFPNHNLVSMASSVQGGQLSIAHGFEKDEYFKLSDKKVDMTSTGVAVAILNNHDLAAGLLSNSSYNAEQIRYKTAIHNNTRYTSLFSEEWIIKGVGGKALPLPELTVVISGDSNKDGHVTWQDAAYEMAREIPSPLGADKLRNAYTTITMNFASGGQYPFYRQLDNIKKFYLATDGFSQMLELKGYQSEGHDSAHPDYAGNYNHRAGGHQGLRALIENAKLYNAHIGVHLNHSEAYPEAKAYTDRIMTDVPGWSWLDQAYLINKRQDILDGTFKARIEQLNYELPDLAFVYLDTYREERSIAQYTAQLFNNMNWGIWTEEPNIFFNNAIWTHHIPESKSLISRFLFHQYRDGFAYHPVLMAGYDRSAAIGFMGWQKGRDFNQVIRNFFTQQLPYRYMMHFPIRNIEESSVFFDSTLEANSSDGLQYLKKDGRLIKKGNTVFIPWDPIKEDKIYFYADSNGVSEWELPSTWSGLSEIYRYQLSSEGKSPAEQIFVQNGRIQLDAIAGQGYVLYKKVVTDNEDMDWGEGSGMINPGFDGKLVGWNTSGDNADVFSLPYGQSVLQLSGHSEASQLVSVEEGHGYYASVWVQVHGRGKATLAVNGQKFDIVESKVKNYFDNTDRYNTYFQRIKIPVQDSSNVMKISLSFQAENDSSYAFFDDVRIVKAQKKMPLQEDIVYVEDFEDVDEGWGPFIPSKPSAFKTHLSERNEPYTDDHISGRYALKTWNERNGEVYRTSPAIIKLKPQEKYRLRFDYKSNKPDAYEVVIRSVKDNKEVLRKVLNGVATFDQVFEVGIADDYYIAIDKSSNAVFILDNFELSNYVVYDKKKTH